MIPIAILLLAMPAAAQLNGLYTIDSSQPTAGTNFASFAAAVTALGAGVSGPTTFQVAPGVGAYAGWSLNTPVTGASAANPVTFVASGPVVISGAAPGFSAAIQLGTSTAGGPSYIVIDGFEVQNATASAGIITGGASNITVRNCRVHNCGTGICFATTQNSVAEDNEVYAVGNTVAAPGSTTYCGGITLYLDSNGCTVQRNKVRDCTGNGIFIGTSSSATSPDSAIVVNNMVWNCPGLGTYPGGIVIRRSGASVISNNSVVMTTGAMAGIHQTAGGTANPQPAEISNNVIQHLGTGACFKFEANTVTPAGIFDYNLYDAAPTAALGQVGTVNTTTLPAWQALAAPLLTGKELNTLATAAGFVSGTDLHISAGSAAFESGSVVTGVTVDIDLQPRPLGATPDRGADEAPASGLFASFNATAVTGNANLSVTFADTSFSSAPGGVLSWAWDFQNDGTDDAFVQNPSFVYTCPGIYSVKLTVTDASNPPSTLIRTNYITVSNHVFDMTTTGVGDLTIKPVPTNCGAAAGAASGWTLASLTTSSPVGTGPLAGLYPDFTTISFITNPAAPGNIIHFVVAPGLYPDAGPLALPPGTFNALIGYSLDAVMVYLTPAGGLLHITNVDRVTF